MDLQTIGFGSVLKVWTERRGHDYVVVGEDTVNRRLLLVKNNCLNNDGSVHGATKHFHIRLPYTVIGGNRIVSGVTRILGNKDIRHYDFSRLFLEEGSARTLPALRTFKTNAQINNLTSSAY